MRKYLSFFKNRFYAGLQYRTASVTALLTQFLWGLMECMAFRVILESNPAASPMELTSVISYIWLKEAFFALFTVWATDNDIFDMIMDGGIAYEMCRPVSVYNMWYSRTIGGRTASAAMRCVPILIGAFLAPEPYKMKLPVTPAALLLFFLTMCMGLFVTVAFCMLVYILSFFTISPMGLRMILTGAVEFLAGSIIPLPFIPYPVRGILELLPFASMMNVPFRIYSGDLSGASLLAAVILQVFWLWILVLAGKALCRLAERRIVVQGG